MANADSFPVYDLDVYRDLFKRFHASVPLSEVRTFTGGLLQPRGLLDAGHPAVVRHRHWKGGLSMKLARYICVYVTARE